MYVLAEDDDAWVLFHTAVHDGRHGVDKTHLLPLSRVGGGFERRQRLQFPGVATDADVDESRVWPQIRFDAACSGSGRTLLDESRNGLAQCCLSCLAQAALTQLIEHALRLER